MLIPQRRRFTKLAVLAVGLTFLLAYAGGIVNDYAAGQRPRPVAGGPAEQLAALPIAPETAIATYTREQFGAGWTRTGNGCDTRDRVLADEAVAPIGTSGCSVVSGRWRSLYDGATVEDPAALDIDHLVPLAEAWSSGAHAWTSDQREAFANDLDPTRPDALVAVTATSNRTKGDSDPAEWLPTDPAEHCRYARAWITEKAAWGLTIDPAEHQALTNIVATCPGVA